MDIFKTAKLVGTACTLIGGFATAVTAMPKLKESFDDIRKDDHEDSEDKEEA